MFSSRWSLALLRCDKDEWLVKVKKLGVYTYRHCMLCLYYIYIYIYIIFRPTNLLTSLKNKNDYNTWNLPNEWRGFRLIGKRLCESCSTATYSRKQVCSIARHQCPVRKTTIIHHMLETWELVKKKKNTVWLFHVVEDTRGRRRDVWMNIRCISTTQSGNVMRRPPEDAGKGIARIKGNVEHSRMRDLRA